MRYLLLAVLLLGGCAWSIGGTSHPERAKESSATNDCGCAEDMVRLSNAFGMKGPDERRSLAESYKVCIENCRARCSKEVQP